MNNLSNKQSKKLNYNNFSIKASLIEILTRNRDGILRVLFSLLIILMFIFLDIECIFLKYFNTPCLGCGMTRAWKAVFQGDFKAAFQYHKAYFTVPIAFLYIFKGKLLFKKRLWDIIIIVFIVLMFIGNYIHSYILI